MRRLLSIVVGLLLGWSVQASAVASKQYVNPETSLLFADSAQVETAILTTSNIASNAGRISAQYDKGAGAQEAHYYWSCSIALTGTNVVGDVVEWYVATSADGTNIDGGVGASDAALTSNQATALRLLGVLVVYQTTTNTLMTVSGEAYIPTRYFSVGFFNRTTLPTQTSTSAHGCRLTPIPPEMQ